MGTIEEDPEASIWFVPRRAMCGIFWMANALLFTGIILIITSIHKGLVYRAWGGVFLGLGFCALFTCFVLCIHAYCIITVDPPAQTYEKSLPPATPLSHLGSTLTSSASQPLTSDRRSHLTSGTQNPCDCRGVATSPLPLCNSLPRSVAGVRGVAAPDGGMTGGVSAAKHGVRRSPDYGVRPCGNGVSVTPQSMRSLRFTEHNLTNSEAVRVGTNKTDSNGYKPIPIELHVDIESCPLETRFDRQMEMLSQGYHSTETDDALPEVANVTMATNDVNASLVTNNRSSIRNQAGNKLARQDHVVNTKESVGQRMDTSLYDNIWSKDAEVLHFEV